MHFKEIDNYELLEILDETVNEVVKRGILLQWRIKKLSPEDIAFIKFQVEEKNRIETERKRLVTQTERELENQKLKAESDRIRRQWELKAAVIQAICEWGYSESFQVVVWKRESDRRVYIQSDYGRKSWSYCLYVSGSYKYPDGTLVNESVASERWFKEENRLSKLKPFLAAIADDWSEVKIKLDDFTGTDVKPNQKRLAKYLEALGLTQQVTTT